MRSVVTVCELREDAQGKYRGLPTVVEVSGGRTGLGQEWIAIASPYTIPRNRLLSREGNLPPQLYERLEEALRRVFGWAPWP